MLPFPIELIFDVTFYNIILYTKGKFRIKFLSVQQKKNQLQADKQ